MLLKFSKNSFARNKKKTFVKRHLFGRERVSNYQGKLLSLALVMHSEQVHLHGKSPTHY